MLRANYARELLSWAFLPIMLGAVEGGTVSIVVKKHFAALPEVSPSELNFAVAAVTAAPAMANITSFLWAGLAHGRPKVPFIAALQIATAAMVLLLGLCPQSVVGLAAFTAATILARVFWSGVITLRTAVWRANYPHADRARIAGKMATVQSIVLAATGFAIGKALDFSPASFLIVYPAAAAFGLVGNAIYRRVRLRGQRRLARAESSGRREERPTLSPMSVVSVLREDRSYRRFMTWMFVFGLGNLMISAPLAISLEDRIGVTYLEGILVTTIIPLATMPLIIPLWARLLGRLHIIEFRAVHGWSFVLASTLLFIAAWFESFPLYCLASMFLGVGFAGGVGAGHLGHHAI
ncbi:MAG: MFS transporter, partial [Phycisphaerales bacterium]